MSTTADYAAAVARLLAAHPELPVANVEIRPPARLIEFPGAAAVAIQVASLDEVARWAAACDTTTALAQDGRDVNVCALFTCEGIEVRVWGHVSQDEERDLLVKVGGTCDDAEVMSA